MFIMKFYTINIFNPYSFFLKLREEKKIKSGKLLTYRQQVLELLTKWERSFLPQDAQLNAASPILRLTRSGETAWGPLPGGDWTIFQANHSTYEPLAWAHRDSLDYPANKSPLATVIQVRHTNRIVFFRPYLSTSYVRIGPGLIT